MGGLSPDLFKLGTAGGKEESFFVIQRGGSGPHLYLGFEREALIPVARQIALTLHEKAYQGQILTMEDFQDIWFKIGKALTDQSSSNRYCQRCAKSAARLGQRMQNVFKWFCTALTQEPSNRLQQRRRENSA